MKVKIREKCAKAKTNEENAEETLYDFFGHKHCVKSVQIWSFLWSEFSRIQSECRKIRTRKHSVFGHFSRTANRTVKTKV